MINVTEKEIMQNWAGNIHEPVVSICCITYNHEKFIAEALDSFLMQETYFHFEIVIEDDCSTDSTAMIIQQYAERFPTIINVNLRNVNVGAAQNALECLNRTTGTYIAFCEGDDYWTDNNKLEYQISKMKEYDSCDISFHPVTIQNDFIESDSEFNDFALKNAPDKVELENNKLIFARHNDKTAVYDVNYSIKGGGSFMPTSSIIIKRDNVLNVPLFLSNQSVLDYFLQIFGSLNGGALYINNLMSTYRIHKNGAASSQIGNGELVANAEISKTFTLIELDKFLYPKLHKELIIEISKRWDNFFIKKDLSVTESIDLFLKLHPYLSLDQKNYFSEIFEKLFVFNNYVNKKLDKQFINNIRDTAVAIEEINIELAYNLMQLAYKARPTGLFIKRKLESYKKRLNY